MMEPLSNTILSLDITNFVMGGEVISDIKQFLSRASQFYNLPYNAKKIGEWISSFIDLTNGDYDQAIIDEVWRSLHSLRHIILRSCDVTLLKKINCTIQFETSGWDARMLFKAFNIP